MLNSLTDKKLIPWTPQAFNDIFWTQIDYKQTTGMGKSSSKKYYPSLSRPDSYWLAKYTESGSLLWSPVMVTLQSTQDKVVMEITRNVIGSEKSKTVRVNDGTAHTFEQDGNDWLLKNENGNVTAKWQQGAVYNKFPLDEEAIALGNPDDPHVYSPIIVDGENLGEMLIVMGTSTFARFVHQPPTPLIKNVPETLTPKQKEFLLCFLMLQVTQI